MSMSIQTKLGSWLIVFVLPALAQSEIFLCVDEHGNRTYQNVGTGKGCRKIELQPLNSVPAVKRPVSSSNAGNTSGYFNVDLIN